MSAIASAPYAQTLSITCLLIGIWCLLSSFQWLADSGRFRAGAALGWDLFGLRRGRIYRSGRLNRLFRSELFALVPGLRAVSGLVLICMPPPGWALPALILAAICSGLLALRITMSDGADKIGLISIGAAILIAAGSLLGDPLLAFAGILWAGGQLAIAYGTSGISKLALPIWRDGSAVKGSMSGYTFGHRYAHWALQRPAVALWLSWTVILAETVFPLALLAPPPVLLSICAGFALFHFATAFFMGLNTYPWAFATTYPSAILFSRIVRQALGWG